jgi:hypothetical protein
VRIEVRKVLSAVSETIAFVWTKDMWQSTQLFAIPLPIFLEMPQLCHVWHFRQRSEYSAALRSGACTSWQVEQVMEGEDK